MLLNLFPIRDVPPNNFFNTQNLLEGLKRVRTRVRRINLQICAFHLMLQNNFERVKREILP
jgi:hypothetical protein